MVNQQRRIAQFALKIALPSAYTYWEHAEAGGLIAYAPSYDELFRRAAAYVDKILKGANPRRSAHRAADEVRAGHQPQDGQGPSG